MSTQKLPADQVTSEVIAEWKQKHGNVFQYEAEDGKKAYFRKPSRPEIEAASALAISNKQIQSNAMLARTTFLGGDECIINEDQYFFGLSGHLAKIIKKVEGELTEL